MRTRALRALLPMAVALLALLVPSGSPAAATVTVTSHFIWTAESSNTVFYVTEIDNGATNGEGNALLFVTPNNSAGGVCGCVTDTVPVGVIYNLLGSGGWAIFNLDQSTDIGAGSAYNVLVVQKSSANVFVQTATTANTTGDSTYIDSPLTNGKPKAQLLVTPDVDPGGTNEYISDHAVGVWYDTVKKKWAIFNEDETAMGVGAHFNVMVGSKASNGGKEITEQATTSNSSGDSVLLDSPETIGNPNAAVFETPNWNPGGSGGTYDTAVPGVEYLPGPTDNWAVFQEDGADMPLDAAFNVLAFPS